MRCADLDEVLPALVDGELGTVDRSAARERAQRHLVHCPACRAEVDAHRRLKARLAALPVPAPSDDLTARLLALAATASGDGDGDGPALAAPRRPLRAPAPLLTRPGTGRRDGVPTAPRRPGGRSARRATRVGSALAVLGVGMVLALGSPRATDRVVPADPTGDLVVDYANNPGNPGNPGSPATAPTRPQPAVARLLP